VPKEKVAEIAADSMTSYSRLQIDALSRKTQDHTDSVLPRVVFGHESIKGPARQISFFVVLPEHRFESSVAKQLQKPGALV
jgi:hypothetical protein